MKSIRIPRIPAKTARSVLLIRLLWSLAALFSFFVSSCLILNLEEPFSIGLQKILLNLLIEAFVIGLIFALTLRHVLSFVIGSFLLELLALVSSYVYVFRGTELMPMDIFSAGTAANVLGQYKLFLTPMMAGGLALYLATLLSALFLPAMPAKLLSGKMRLLLRPVSLSLCLLFFFIWLSAGRSIYIETWGNNGSKNNGYFLNFTLQLKTQLASQKPEGYSKERLSRIEEDCRALEKERGQSMRSAGSLPDIILILEESFTDLSVLGSAPETREPLIPFWQARSENAAGGFVLSPVFGGGTANCEYELLTGGSMAFLPHGATPYELYIDRPTWSMAWYLKSLGYTTAATHPYLASGWNRPAIYPLLGFDEASFIESYPGKDLIRDYISDAEMFETIKARYEAADHSRPSFLFGITMQNHGGYEYEGDNPCPVLPLTGQEGRYPKAEQYLGLIRESDRALEDFFSYFETVDRDVLIVVFGDHYPWIEIEYLEQLYGGPFDSLPAQQLEYMTPFLIWSNYEREPLEVPLLSLSRLSSLIYEAAGIEKPPVNLFLDRLAETIPALNTQGFYSKESGSYLPFSEGSEKEQALLTDYACLQYNSLFESEPNSYFFPGLAS